MIERPDRLHGVSLDNETILTSNEAVEQERRIAIIQLIEDSVFEPVFLDPLPVGPYGLRLSLQGGSLLFEVSDADDRALGHTRLPLQPLRRLVRQYLVVCDGYYAALNKGRPQGFRAVDLGRQGLHDEGAVILRERLNGRIQIDELTSRRLFTLLAVLHTKDTGFA